MKSVTENWHILSMTLLLSYTRRLSRVSTKQFVFLQPGLATGLFSQYGSINLILLCIQIPWLCNVIYQLRERVPPDANFKVSHRRLTRHPVRKKKSCCEDVLKVSALHFVIGTLQGLSQDKMKSPDLTNECYHLISYRVGVPVVASLSIFSSRNLNREVSSILFTVKNH